MRLRHADREPGDDRDVPQDRRQRRNGEVVVAVEDPDDDSGDAEQRDDREEHAREPDRERTVVTWVAEQVDHPRRDEHEQRRQRRQAEQHQPEQARCDTPRPFSLPLLEQLAEDRDERRRERGVGNERADEVRHLERDGERVDPSGRAEVVGGDDLAHEPEHAREPGRRGEDRARDREPRLVGLVAARGADDDRRLGQVGRGGEMLEGARPIEVRRAALLAPTAVALEAAELPLAI